MTSNHRTSEGDMLGLKKIWLGIRRRFADGSAEWATDMKQLGWKIKLGLAGLVVLLLLWIGLGIYWSWEPPLFDVLPASERELAEYGHEPVTGTATAAALITAAETLLEKPGGFITNDITPPGLWMDNMPNWEYGVLIQVRDLSKAMREAFSRSQSQSLEDANLATAESRFNFDNSSWALPPAESEYREGIKYLRAYLQQLSDPDDNSARYYARADNLRYWLDTVGTRLGNLSLRLSASVGERELGAGLLTIPEEGQPALPMQGDSLQQTPWHQIDDVFYEARGSAWALTHFLRAIEIDFADVLERKNARASLRQIIRELEATQQPVRSPMILNGGGFGFLANHSLVMAAYISRANAALIDLRDLLAQG